MEFKALEIFTEWRGKSSGRRMSLTGRAAARRRSGSPADSKSLIYKEFIAKRKSR